MSIDTEETERTTVRVARSRDDDFVAFVETAGPYLYRTAYLLSGDRHRAEDLVQTVFERTYRVWDKVRDGEPRGYARRVLVNLRIDTWRHTRREVVPGDDHIPVGATPDGSRDVELRDALVRALARLAPQQRRVVVLRHLLDLSEADVAAELAGASARSRRPTPARWNASATSSRVPTWRSSTRPSWTPSPCCATAGRRCAGAGRRRVRRRAPPRCCWCGSWRARCGCQGRGDVALPGSEWFREATGIERLLEDAEPAPGLTDGPALPAAEVDPLRETFAVPGDETATGTLAEDGSYFMVKTFPESGTPGVPDGAGSSVVEAVEIQEDGIAHAAEYAGSAPIDGRGAKIVAAVREGDRLAWVEYDGGRRLPGRLGDPGVRRRRSAARSGGGAPRVGPVGGRRGPR